jgi:two-component system, cell cycle sensor histidine kinase and response regulator CckA
MSGSQPARANRVLLVDSDYRTSHRLAGLLRDDGFEVDVVRDGAAAIAHLARAPLPDTLITELKMRFADGVSVARYARAQRPGLPVIVLTGHPHLLRQGELGSPPPLVLTKPLDYGQLLAALAPTNPSATATASPFPSAAAEKC